MFHFFTAKLYEGFQQMNPYNAAKRVTGYLTVFYLFLAYSILGPVLKYLNGKYLDLNVNTWVILVVLMVLAVVIYNIIYRRLFKTNRIEAIVKRYEHILVPVLILYFGLLLCIPMFLSIYNIMDQWLNDSGIFNLIFSK